MRSGVGWSVVGRGGVGPRGMGKTSVAVSSLGHWGVGCLNDTKTVDEFS